MGESRGGQSGSDQATGSQGATGQDQAVNAQREGKTEEGFKDDEWIPGVEVPGVEVDVKVDLRKALLGGALAALVSISGSWFVGRLHGAEGLVLLEAMLPTTRFLCSAVMTATATILALMLTLLGLSADVSNKIHPSHFERVRQIALIDTVAFAAATLFLLILNIPLEESDNLSTEWYDTIYYSVLTFSSLLGGLLISAVLMLYDAVRDMIYILGLRKKEHPLFQKESRSEA
jgi:hypothetical protein